MAPPARTGNWLHVLAAALGVFVLLEVIAAAVLSAIAGWSWQDALDAFVVTNSAIGLSFGICGAILAWHRPRNPIGWLFAAGGVAYSTSALAAPLGAVLHDAAAPIAMQRLLITIFSWSWPWAIGLFLPLALLLFPDGRPLSRGWRWVVIAVIITAPLFAAGNGRVARSTAGRAADRLSHTLAGTPPCNRYGSPPRCAYHRVRCSWALAALAVRYRRGSDVERRQLLWLLLAVAGGVDRDLALGLGRRHARRGAVRHPADPDCRDGGDRAPASCWTSASSSLACWPG